MSSQLYEYRDKVFSGGMLTREEALRLAEEPDLEGLAKAADEIRAAYCQDAFDLCGVLSIKGGRCTENCRFCPQSCAADAHIRSFPLLSPEEILREARVRADQGVQHYCLVSNGRKISDRHLDQLLEAIHVLREETPLLICVSLGLLDAGQLHRLKEAGVSRVHNNLETSPRYFSSLCTSHSYEEKRRVVREAHAAGLEVCCGGIIGAGERMEDRIDLALEVRALGAESVPVNLLHAYPGTPMEHQEAISADEVIRTIALFRMLIPGAFIRLAAGRDRLEDTGMACFRSGSNAAITGDMLNVRGITVERDLQNIAGRFRNCL